MVRSDWHTAVRTRRRPGSGRNNDSSSIPPPDAPQLATFVLVWSSVRARRERRPRAHAFGELRASGHAALGLTVAGRGWRRRSPAQWQPQHFTVEWHGAAVECNLIPDPDHARGF